MSKRKTQEEFEKEVYELYNDEFEVEGIYINNLNKIKIKHNICGNSINVRPDHFLRMETGCKTCIQQEQIKLKMKTTNEFKIEVENLVGDDYTILSNYNGSQKKIKIRHNICGYT